MSHGSRRLLALGGGGFTSSSEDWPLDELVAELCHGDRPRICLLPTASGDPAEQIDRFYQVFSPLGCRPSHVSLFRLGSRPLDLHAHLLSQDAIYVGGGSLLNLLTLWRLHGVDATLATAYRRGVLLAGVSAGAMCWFEAGVTRTHGEPSLTTGLGLLPGSLSVHDSSDPQRSAAFRAAVADGAPAGLAADDGVALAFADERLTEAVSSRPTAGARRVFREHGRVSERPIEPRLLTSGSRPDTTPASISEYREAVQHRSRARSSSLRSGPPA